MADTITLLPRDDDGERILDEFEEQTGLTPEDDEDRARIYALEGDDHRIEIVQSLDDIAADWPEHIGLEWPA
jgi:hypothetical protein